MFALILSACNAKSSDDNEVAISSANTAITNFYLTANNSVLSDLDSVFFSIDLQNGVIFNADSLPVGTNITRLIPSITFANTMTEVNLTFRKNNENDTTINYLTNPTDSIDFTNPVSLNVTAADGINKFTYTLKVNVHKENPDSLMWDKLATTWLPSISGTPAEQKTVVNDQDKFITLIRERDNSFSLSTAIDLNEAEWTTEEIVFPFMPVVNSFSFSGGKYYILSEEGDLYASENAKEWDFTSQEGWISIIGPYLDSILGLKQNGSETICCHYPSSPLITEGAVSSDFPIKGRSALASISSAWSPLPTAFFVGGTTASGEYSGFCWAFDGSSWTQLSSSGLVEISGATVVNYSVFKNSSTNSGSRQLNSWLLFGGELADGSFNRTIRYSPDNGISWFTAPASMQLPEEFPSIKGADGFTYSIDLTASLSQAWTQRASLPEPRWFRISYTVDGLDITWDCPYLYIFGGILPDNSLSDEIWRGVLARLRFTPLI